MGRIEYILKWRGCISFSGGRNISIAGTHRACGRRRSSSWGSMLREWEHPSNCGILNSKIVVVDMTVLHIAVVVVVVRAMWGMLAGKLGSSLHSIRKAVG